MWADGASKIDMLAYEPYAELVYEVAISERMNPLTIGLFGNWGSGKSTLLHLIEKKVLNERKEAQNIAVVSVNAWMFEGYDDAKTALMESILRSMQENEEIVQTTGGKIKKLLKRVDWIRVGSTVAKKGIPLGLSLLAGNPLPMLMSGLSANDFDDEKKIEKHMETYKNLKEEYIKQEEEKNVIDNIRKFREEFGGLINESGIDNLIIIIDDLDRCNPDRIVETLEAIKLFLSVEKTTFIIAMDEDVITYSIKRKYPQLEEIDIDVSKDYIEKIIQLPISVSELSEIDVKNYMLLLVCEMYLKEEVLNKLLQQLKRKGIFVRGEIISARDIDDTIKGFETDVETCVKEGGSFESLEQQLYVFDSIGDIIATTLKGNPRQTKRFLNTFYMRKRLAELQGIDLNLAILAKLMVLEYVDKDLFRELYKWQIEHNGYAEPLKDIEEKALTVIQPEEVERSEEVNGNKNSGWYTDTIKRWIGVEPSNLSSKDLSVYFYLARDAVRSKGLSGNNLGQKERKIINEICNNQIAIVLRKAKIKKLDELDGVTQKEIIKGIISKYNQDKKLYLEVLIEIYKTYPVYQQLLFNEFEKIKVTNITPKEIILFKNGLNTDDFEKIQKHYISKGSKKPLWDMAVDIKGGK
ncbi:KAP family P-loop NTPase fold protein [Bacillus wiedmannii]